MINDNQMKIGIVDVGGGLRGIYAAGVLDYCIDKNIVFDVGIGVSAGSANIASYIANQPKRNYRFYTTYAMRKEYMGWGNFVREKSYVNLDYIYGTLSNSNGENPLDYYTLMNNKTEIVVVATDARTGNPVYFDKRNIKFDNYDIFKASCCIPAICKPYIIDGRYYYDGAIADAIPIDKAFELGCDKVIVILSLPENIQRKNTKDRLLSICIRHKYPNSAEKFKNKNMNYDLSLKKAQKLVEDGKVLILSPDDTCGIDTLKRNREGLKRLYKKGYNDAIKIESFLGL